MPKRILLIGLLFVLGGVFSIWSIIEAAMHNRIHLNFGVLMLPTGIGLLRGRASSQWWARFWILLGYLALLAMVCMVLAYPESAKASWFGTQIRGGKAIPYVLAIAALVGVALRILHRLLYSPKASAFLSNR
jgi:hypothetical protein